MSDTTEADAQRAAATEPSQTEPTQPETRTDTAPGAETETADEAKTPDPAKPTPDPRDRAIRQMAFEQRETRRQLQALRDEQARANPPDPNAPPTQADINRIVEERAAQLIEQRETRAKTDTWATAGAAEYPDFTERCNQLADMGAGENPHFMAAILDVPDGHKLVATLAEQPAEAARILRLAPVPMAIALANMAHQIAAAPPPPPPRPTTQAPPPIRPLSTANRAEPSLDNLEGDAFRAEWHKRTRSK